MLEGLPSSHRCWRCSSQTSCLQAALPHWRRFVLAWHQQHTFIGLDFFFFLPGFLAVAAVLSDSSEDMPLEPAMRAAIELGEWRAGHWTLGCWMCAKHPGSVCCHKGHKCCLSKVCYTVFVLYPVDLIWYTYDIYIYTIATTCTRNIIYNISRGGSGQV